jgi:hypothetical protein
MNSPHRLTAAAPGHTCGAASCGTDISAETFLCERHTTMLSAALRHAIRDSYEPGQAPTANRYLSAAIEAIAHKEKRAKTTVGLRKPVQLALFEL